LRNAADDEDEGTENEGRSGRKELAEVATWRKVRLGLLLYMIRSASVWAWLLLLIIGIWWGFLGLTGFFWCLVVLFQLLAVAGHWFLAYTPERYASRSSMHVVIGIDALFLLNFFAFFIIFVFPVYFEKVPPHFTSLTWITMVPLGLLGWLQFFLHRNYLKQIAKAMEVTQAEDHFDTMIKWQLLPAAIWLAAPVVGRIPGGFWLLLIVSWIFGLAAFLLHMHIHILLRAGIADHMRHLRPRRKKRQGKSTEKSNLESQ
jgi:hypothetical protein